MQAADGPPFVIAYWAADKAAYSIACNAAYCAADSAAASTIREKQIEKLKEIIKGEK